jgi:hypothetical protein
MLQNVREVGGGKPVASPDVQPLLVHLLVSCKSYKIKLNVKKISNSIFRNSGETNRLPPPMYSRFWCTF